MNIAKPLQLISLTLLIATSNITPLIAHSNIYNFFGPNRTFLKYTENLTRKFFENLQNFATTNLKFIKEHPYIISGIIAAPIIGAIYKFKSCKSKNHCAPTKASEIQNITFNNFDKHKYKKFILDMFETEHENLVGDCKEFSANYALKNLQLFPGSEPITIKVACLNNMPIGFVIYSMWDEGIGQIDVLCVNNSYRQYGYGKELLNHAIQKLINEKYVTSIRLGVHKNNHCAINLYCKCGFSFLKHHDSTTNIYSLTI